MPSKLTTTEQRDYAVGMQTALHALADVATTLDEDVFTARLTSLMTYSYDTASGGSHVYQGYRDALVRLAYMANTWMGPNLLPLRHSQFNTRAFREHCTAAAAPELRLLLQPVFAALDQYTDRAEFVKAMQYPAAGDPPSAAALAMATAITVRAVAYVRDFQTTATWTALGSIAASVTMW